MARQNNTTAAAYSLARDRYAALGVDTEKVLKDLAEVPVSLHCWQGDDVGGFENQGGALTGGIMATGNYPGKARTPEELRAFLAVDVNHRQPAGHEPQPDVRGRVGPAEEREVPIGGCRVGRGLLPTGPAGVLARALALVALPT